MTIKILEKSFYKARKLGAKDKQTRKRKNIPYPKNGTIEDKMFWHRVHSPEAKKRLKERYRIGGILERQEKEQDNLEK